MHERRESQEVEAEVRARSELEQLRRQEDRIAENSQLFFDTQSKPLIVPSSSRLAEQNSKLRNFLQQAGSSKYVKDLGISQQALDNRTAALRNVDSDAYPVYTIDNMPGKLFFMKDFQ